MPCTEISGRVEILGIPERAVKQTKPAEAPAVAAGSLCGLRFLGEVIGEKRLADRLELGANPRIAREEMHGVEVVDREVLLVEAIPAVGLLPVAPARPLAESCEAGIRVLLAPEPIAPLRVGHPLE